MVDLTLLVYGMVSAGVWHAHQINRYTFSNFRYYFIVTK